MRIEYELKYRDYLLFSAMHQLFSVTTQLFFAGCAVLIFYSFRGEASLGVSLILAVFAYLATWTIQLVFSVFYLYFGNNRSLLTKHIVEIQSDAFYEETQFNRSHHFWPGIAKVISRPGFIAVYVNGNAAHILPNRAFSSREHRRVFLSALRRSLSVA